MHIGHPEVKPSHRSVTIRSRTGMVLAGIGQPTRVMALTGITTAAHYVGQVEKINLACELPARPEIIGDLSLCRPWGERPLWRYILEETPACVATLPIYLVRQRSSRLDPHELLDVALEQIQAGVGMVTIHPTPTLELVERARARLTPWTSRGGGMVIRDLLARDSGADNVYIQILDELAGAALQHGTVVSLGASFRSANIFDAFDAAQCGEIDLQLQIADDLTRRGIQVVIESPGHARPADLQRIAARLRSRDYPVMPLGPIPTDDAIGMDHLAGAIGATLFGLVGCAQIIAAVTREEHTGGIPSVESTLEAIRCARIAAHVIDLDRLGSDDTDRRIATSRADSRTCVVGKRTPGCARCGRACPL